MGKIQYDITNGGFLKDAAYSHYLFEFLNKYKDKFGNAESIVVTLTEEIPYGVIVSFKDNKINISDDGKKVDIKYLTTKFYNRKGVSTGKPTPQSESSSLAFLMNRAVKEYSEKFDIAE
jgi:hypothetical protein